MDLSPVASCSHKSSAFVLSRWTLALPRVDSASLTQKLASRRAPGVGSPPHEGDWLRPRHIRP
jgi:hypothetical protein